MKREKLITTLCTFASKNELQIGRSLEKLGFQLINFIDTKEDMQGYLCECEEGQVLVFRETEKKWIDWLNNCRFWTKDTMIGDVHGGYWDVLYNNYDKVVRGITDRNLLTTGFSQGGGLAEQAGALLHLTLKGDPIFFNIDGPAIRKGEGYSNGYFTVKSNDPVPQLPPEALGYSHKGNLIYFTTRGNMLYNPRRMWQRLDFLAQTVIDVAEFSQGTINLEHNIQRINQDWLNNWGKIKKKIEEEKLCLI